MFVLVLICKSTNILVLSISVFFFSTSSEIGNVKQVLIRLIGADENMQFGYMDTMQCVEDTDVLEMIVDKFSSSVCDMLDPNV